jgi:hypothetical protein
VTARRAPADPAPARPQPSPAPRSACGSPTWTPDRSAWPRSTGPPGWSSRPTARSAPTPVKPRPAGRSPSAGRLCAWSQRPTACGSATSSAACCSASTRPPAPSIGVRRSGRWAASRRGSRTTAPACGWWTRRTTGCCRSTRAPGGGAGRTRSGSGHGCSGRDRAASGSRTSSGARSPGWGLMGTTANRRSTPASRRRVSPRPPASSGSRAPRRTGCSASTPTRWRWWRPSTGSTARTPWWRTARPCTPSARPGRPCGPSMRPPGRSWPG